MKFNISIGRENDGDMIGSLAVNIGAENSPVYKVYVRDLKQAINEIKKFIIDNFEDDGADICWRVKQGCQYSLKLTGDDKNNHGANNDR